jgi:hypothetical protein
MIEKYQNFVDCQQNFGVTSFFVVYAYPLPLSLSQNLSGGGIVFLKIIFHKNPCFKPFNQDFLIEKTLAMVFNFIYVAFYLLYMFLTLGHETKLLLETNPV